LVLVQAAELDWAVVAAWVKEGRSRGGRWRSLRRFWWVRGLRLLRWVRRSVEGYLRIGKTHGADARLEGIRSFEQGIGRHDLGHRQFGLKNGSVQIHFIVVR
jgi:hypothetical protein